MESYRPFIENADNNIAWIDWVNKGDEFDNIDCCPYCSEGLKENHIQKKEIFKKTYKKKDSQNLKEILELVQELKEFISDEKYNDLIKYIKSETPDDVIKTIVDKLTTELDLLISRFDVALFELPENPKIKYIAHARTIIPIFILFFRF